MKKMDFLGQLETVRAESAATKEELASYKEKAENRRAFGKINNIASVSTCFISKCIFSQYEKQSQIYNLTARI